MRVGQVFLHTTYLDFVEISQVLLMLNQTCLKNTWIQNLIDKHIVCKNVRTNLSEIKSLFSYFAGIFGDHLSRGTKWAGTIWSLGPFVRDQMSGDQMCSGLNESQPSIIIQYWVDVLWGQPIKQNQVASTSELRENQWNDLLFFEIVPCHFFGASEVQT